MLHDLSTIHVTLHHTAFVFKPHIFQTCVRNMLVYFKLSTCVGLANMVNTQTLGAEIYSFVLGKE